MNIVKIKSALVSLIFFSAALMLAKNYEKEGTDKAKSGKNWNFEIQSKTARIIKIKVENRDEGLNVAETLARGKDQRKLRIAEINAGAHLIVTISENINEEDAVLVSKYIEPNRNRKTIYLTIEPNLGIRPQTGILKGLLPSSLQKTDSGLKLDKKTNVQTTEIKDHPHK